MIMFFFFFILVYSFLFHFSSKLMVLLCLECLMLGMIGVYFYLFPFKFGGFLFGLVFSIFMVLDSVFCVSLLISGSRSGSGNFMVYNSF